ncbi:MAG: DNA repair and recombination protein RadB [Thermoplasmata archaeon]|nr:MAG: DNA repair and recombination protein RadB [Thermoplasmata archaeon]
MERLPTGCKSLDDLLGGGVEGGIITEFYGEAGCGKTNLCLQISRETAKLGKKVAYIDTEGVSIERLNQICEGDKQILSNILFFSPHSLEEQEHMVRNALKIKNLKTVIIDTINMFYRMKIDEDEEVATRSIVRQLTNLQISARKDNLFAVITGQVYSTEDGDVKPFAGRGMEHMAKTIVKLERIGMGKRRAIIIKHRSQPEGLSAEFEITEKGLV